MSVAGGLSGSGRERDSDVQLHIETVRVLATLVAALPLCDRQSSASKGKGPRPSASVVSSEGGVSESVLLHERTI